MSTVWLDGALVAAEDAKISALDRGVLWGYGLFETLRAYGGRVYGMDPHLERCREGAARIGIPLPSDATLRDAVASVLTANGLEGTGGDAGVRITITRGAGGVDPHEDVVGDPTTLVTAWLLRDYGELYGTGAALVTLDGGGRPLAGIKTTSYAPSVVGRLDAARAGADDALFVDGDEVLEATGSNLMFASDDELVTPPLRGDLLPGVTRAAVLAVAARCGLVPGERTVRVSELHAADEVILTSSLREVYPVRSIDGRSLRMCGVAARLREAYRAHVRATLGA